MSKSSKRISIYEAGQRQKIGLFRILFAMIKDIRDSWDLILQLYKRDFLMKYKQSFLGMGWLFLGPLLGFVQWVFMNTAGVLNPGEFNFPYPAYVLISTTIWGVFAISYIVLPDTECR
jgi:lipopolysaccharide transport system permease protein